MRKADDDCTAGSGGGGGSAKVKRRQNIHNEIIFSVTKEIFTAESSAFRGVVVLAPNRCAMVAAKNLHQALAAGGKFQYTFLFTKILS